MKICSKCGAKQSDDHNYCIDCSERLGNSISDVEEQKVMADLEIAIDKMDKKMDNIDPLFVSVFDRIIGYCSLIGAFAAIVFLIVYKQNTEYVSKLVITTFCFLMCSFTALAPKILWTLDKIKLSFIINGADDAEPSDLYLITRKK